MSNPARSSAVIVAFLALLIYPLALADEPAANPLKLVKNFMIQLDDLDDAAAVDRLAKSGYDMLVVEPTFSIKGNEKFDVKAMVKSLHDGKPGRIVLAYLNIGEAESNRSYWHDDWHVASAGTPARPGYLLAADPDGDATTFLVLYWKARWQNIFVGPRGLVDKIMAAGFDGVCLDGVDANDEQQLEDIAAKEKVDTSKTMVNLVAAVRARVRQIKPDGVVVAENAAFLIDDQPKYADSIDGVLFEETWFSGKDDADWDGPDAGDIPNTEANEDSPTGLVREYQKYRAAGLPVFTVDHCVNPQNAARVYQESAAAGFVPLVTRSSEDDITPTPPPNLAKTQ
jgi:cysteinyl-tRNA synthetase, unknown class